MASLPTHRVATRSDLPRALQRIGVAAGVPVLAVVGGAAGLGADVLDAVDVMLSDHVVPSLERLGGAAVDGGTDSGVMAALGRAVSAAGRRVPLVGVAAEGTVSTTLGRPTHDDRAPLDSNHTGVLLVPGDTWGDESPWIDLTVAALSAGQPSATLLVNGGRIAHEDARRSLEASRPLLVVRGSGRAADELARGTENSTLPGPSGRRSLIHVVDIDMPSVVAAMVEELLSRPTS